MKKDHKIGNAAETILLSAADGIGLITGGKCTLDDFIDFQVPKKFRRTIGHLLLCFFRNRLFIQTELQKLVSRKPDHRIENILLAAFTQIRFQDGISMQSAVSVAVDAAKKHRADKFVNAVLRKFAASASPFPEDPADILPPQICTRWGKRFSAQQLKELAELFVSEADFTFRMEKNVQEVDFPCELIMDNGKFRFYRADPADVIKSQALADGRIYIQDPATAFAPSLPDYSAVKSVIDLCAAPGGKALMMSENLTDDAKLTAFDRSQARQILTKQNFDKRKLRHSVIFGNIEELTGSFDLVMADVPCSNTGVFRHRPDALWRFSTGELKKITVIQKNILEHAARLTAPGGQLVYSTCSIEPEENELLIDGFLAGHPEFTLAARDTILPNAGSDGCSAALLKRCSCE